MSAPPPASSPVPLDPVFVNDIKILKERGVDRDSFAKTMRDFVNDASKDKVIEPGTEESLFNRLMAVYDDFQPGKEEDDKFITKVLTRTPGASVIFSSLIEKLSGAEQQELIEQMDEAYKLRGEEGWVRLPPKLQKMLNDYRGTPGAVDSIRAIESDPDGMEVVWSGSSKDKRKKA